MEFSQSFSPNQKQISGMVIIFRTGIARETRNSEEFTGGA